MSDTERLTLADLTDLSRHGKRIAMITAYDASSAALADAAGLDVVLVGDSAAMTILGHQSTLPVTMDEMLMLTRAVTRGVRRAFVVADMPFGAYQLGEDEALRNAIRFVKDAGADAVKLEGAGRTLTRISAILDAGIPVMGHVGLTPQSASRARSTGRAALRWCSKRFLRLLPRASPTRSRSRPLASAPVHPATVRCWSGTISSG